MSLGPWEIGLILLVLLLLFGAKRIPEIARGLGKGIREFKDATNEVKKELELSEPPPRQVEPPTQPTQAQTPQVEPEKQPAQESGESSSESQSNAS